MKSYATATALVAMLMSLAPATARADVAIAGQLEQSVKFSADQGGFEANAMTFSREKLKATTKTPGDFNLSNRFNVEINEVPVAGVRSVKGFERDSEVVEYKDGDAKVVHTRPGNHKPGKIVVTKDWSNTSEFYKWHKSILDGGGERKSISVIFHNDAGEEAGRIQAEGCYPVELQTSDSALESIKSSRTEIIVLECSTMILKSQNTAAFNDGNTSNSKMKNGTVKFFNQSAREGIIATDDGQLYQFKSNLDIRPGDKVEFKEVPEGKKGLNAVNVRLA